MSKKIGLTALESKMLEYLKIEPMQWSRPGPYEIQALNRLVKKGLAEKIKRDESVGGFVWALKNE